MPLHNGLTDTIRTILRQAGRALTQREVRDALTARSQAFAPTGISASLVGRVRAGEFIRGGEHGSYEYSLNPKWAGERLPAPVAPAVRGASTAMVRVRKADLQKVVQAAYRNASNLSRAEEAAINACSEVMY